jgi:hypothetical protein
MVENTNLSVARQIAEYFDRIELSSEHTQRVAHNLQTLIVRAQTESWPLSTFLCLLAKITPNRASQLKPYILTAEALASDDIERRLVMQTIERLANPDEELRNIAKKLKKDMQR